MYGQNLDFQYFFQGWSNWNRCSLLCNVGVQTRFRQIGIPRTSPHCRVPTLSQERSCGVPNGGCSETCNTATGACSCRTGYGLARGKNPFVCLASC